MRRLLLFSFPVSLLLLQIVAAQTADLDLWGRLSVGAVLFQAGHLPRIDDFSYTAAGAPWIDHEWLTGVVFYGLLLVGEPALVLFKYAAALLALLLVFVLHGSVYRTSLVPAAWTLALLSPVLRLGFGTTVRAQVFSIALFVLFLLVLERVRLGRSGLRALLGLLPIGAVWGNLHGGFVMGVLALGCYAAAEALGGRIGRAAAHALRPESSSRSRSRIPTVRRTWGSSSTRGRSIGATSSSGGRSWTASRRSPSRPRSPRRRRSSPRASCSSGSSVRCASAGRRSASGAGGVRSTPPNGSASLGPWSSS